MQTSSTVSVVLCSIFVRRVIALVDVHNSKISTEKKRSELRFHVTRQVPRSWMRTPMGFTGPQPPNHPAWSYTPLAHFLNKTIARFSRETQKSLSRSNLFVQQNTPHTGYRSHSQRVPSLSWFTLAFSLPCRFCLFIRPSTADRFDDDDDDGVAQRRRRRLTHSDGAPLALGVAPTVGGYARWRSANPAMHDMTCLFLFSTFLKAFFQLKSLYFYAKWVSKYLFTHK